MESNICIDLFNEWNQAIQTGDPDRVLPLYAEDAVLLPTLSNRVRHTHAEIRDYFEHFTEKRPTGVLDESNIRGFGDLLINSGLYTFTFQDGTTAHARFTFIYRKTGDRWLIIEHHSSLLPESD